MSKIQSYEIIEKIGIGGMGTVYKVRHDFKKSIFAIKSLHPQFAQSEEIKERFKNEAKILSHLEHENIVKVEDFIEDATGLHIIMEYVEGRTLDRMIGQEVGPIPYKRALPMFVQILKGIGFAHQKGIIHRDIKPSNIIVTPNNKIKIADFGIAKIGGEGIHTKTGTKMGTLIYMSPEQLKGEKVDERSDIYSLGVTLYEMLAGRHPLRSNEEMSEYSLMTKIITEKFPSPTEFYPDIPQWLVKIVFKAISKDKNERISSVDELIKLLKSKEIDLDIEPQSKKGLKNLPDYDNKEIFYSKPKNIKEPEIEEELEIEEVPEFEEEPESEIIEEPEKKQRGGLFYGTILLVVAVILFGVIRFTGGKEEMVVPREKTGQLNFSINPNTAECKLVKNGVVHYNWIGQTRLSQIPEGSYELSVKAKGYLNITKWITISENLPQTENIELKKDMSYLEVINNATIDDWKFVNGVWKDNNGGIVPGTLNISDIRETKFTGMENEYCFSVSGPITGGNFIVCFFYIATIENGVLRIIGKEASGATWMEPPKFTNNSVILASAGYDKDDGHCCPSWTVYKTYKWINNQLKEVSSTKKRTKK